MLFDRRAAKNNGEERCKKCYNKEYRANSDADRHMIDAISRKVDS